MARPWHRLPREAVGALSREVLEARLDGALSNVVWWKVSVARAGEVERGDLSGPFQSKLPDDSTIL